MSRHDSCYFSHNVFFTFYFLSQPGQNGYSGHVYFRQFKICCLSLNAVGFATIKTCKTYVTGIVYSLVLSSYFVVFCHLLHSVFLRNLLCTCKNIFLLGSHILLHFYRGSIHIRRCLQSATENGQNLKKKTLLH